MSEPTRNPAIGRALAVLAVVAIGTMAVTPAFSAFKATKKKIKSIAQKQVRTIGGELFLEEGTELTRFVQKMVAGQADATLFTDGPFTVKGTCADDGGGGRTAQAVITTSEENSAFDTNGATNETDFDPNDSNAPISWISTSGGPETDTDSGAGHAESPSGTYLTGEITAAVEIGGQDCVFHGWYLDLNA
ncbi:MAG: hypothetical protein M3135_05005 [Actinomycetota bacterium]|nr:hypothetical protein [Actinomycetota bacterium]